jgi:hypothetical protein
MVTIVTRRAYLIEHVQEGPTLRRYVRLLIVEHKEHNKRSVKTMKSMDPNLILLLTLLTT